MNIRSSGILLHPTSLPETPGIGTIGKQAYKFVDWLASANQTLWQILPIGPTGYGDSPYASFSTFAGNPLMIDLDMLKEKGIWIYGADIEGKDYSYNTDFSGPCALIIGSEGKGISNLTLKKCDLLVKIPMVGKINSLNASVAGGIMMYEVLKGRLTK